jgi:hypothetical protein
VWVLEKSKAKQGRFIMENESDLLQRAIAMVRSGDEGAGAELLYDIIEENPYNEMAFLWLAAAINDREEKLQCLDRVLSINPGNEVAREAFDQLMLSPSLDTLSIREMMEEGNDYDDGDKEEVLPEIEDAQAQSAKRPSKIGRFNLSRQINLDLLWLVLGGIVLLVVGFLAGSMATVAGIIIWTNL